jgi:putative ABC transport system substrate-binding protein
MRRREFIAVLSGAATWPLAARPQQSAVPVIGYLSARTEQFDARLLQAFRLGLSEAGYVEGRNVAIEYRWANAKFDQLPVMARELVNRNVTVMVATGGTPAAYAARDATKAIPIVFETGGDPVALGYVSSLSRPGGNLTGITTLNGELMPKRLELMRDLIPNGTAVAALMNPRNPASEAELPRLQAAAAVLGLRLRVLSASSEGDIEDLFASLAGQRADPLVIAADVLFTNKSDRLGALALRHEVPAIFQSREFAAAGGLASYGGSLAGAYRQTGVYVGRVLKGAKPADLPVQQTTSVELIVNLKTARALGVTVPLPLLARADEVIE